MQISLFVFILKIKQKVEFHFWHYKQSLQMKCSVALLFKGIVQQILSGVELYINRSVITSDRLASD
jgi:hypothetical protein